MLRLVGGLLGWEELAELGEAVGCGADGNCRTAGAGRKRLQSLCHMWGYPLRTMALCSCEIERYRRRRWNDAG